MKKNFPEFKDKNVSIINNFVCWIDKDSVFMQCGTIDQEIESIKEMEKLKYFKKTKVTKTIKIKTVLTYSQVKEKPNKKKRKSRTKEFEINREIVIKRDGYRCVTCNQISNLEVHHKQYKSNGGDDSIDNLITVCNLCHYKLHSKESIGNLMRSKLKKQGYML